MTTTNARNIRIADFDYPLPNERIAQFPLPRRDHSRLLLYLNGEISETVFGQLSRYLPAGALLAFNNTRVIEARLLFKKPSGAAIEIFCLEPVEPHDYTLCFQQTSRCRWSCMVGNLKKWKSGILAKTVAVNGSPFLLKAERIQTFGDTHWVDFSWERPEITFAGILEHAGVLPIPPYLRRETAASDLQTYQTVYSKIKGSVAAPTAGLHFTPELLAELDAKGFCREELTLHVGAGTFKPVKSDTLDAHEMHAEYFSVNRSSIERLINCAGKVIAVGTTSVRTLESLYYAGVLLAARPQAAAEEDLIIPQWMPYDTTNKRLSPRKALQNVLDCLDRSGQDKLTAATRLMIVPGYDFQIVNGIITNFHQPKSTLLLLIAAFAGSDWKRIYDYALARRFRFLSYGDCSLLIP